MEKNIHDYDDIIDLPYHKSETRPHMSNYDRAAQFSPFAALTGYDAAIEETARLTEKKIELDEDAKAALDEKLRLLRDRPDRPQIRVSVTYFQPDNKKEGGAYLTVMGRIKKVNGYERTVTLEDGTVISVEDILDIQEIY